MPGNASMQPPENTPIVSFSIQHVSFQQSVLTSNCSVLIPILTSKQSAQVLFILAAALSAIMPSRAGP